MTPSNGTRFTLPSDVRFRLVLDEGIVIRQDANLVYVINELGSEILKRIQSGANYAEICEAIASSYDASADQVEEDVRAFIEHLAAEAIILPAGDS